MVISMPTASGNSNRSRATMNAGAGQGRSSQRRCLWLPRRRGIAAIAPAHCSSGNMPARCTWCVNGDGFEWQGAVYRSLSEIARRITGTSWSGPRFFGLRDNTETTSGDDNVKTEPKRQGRGR